MKTTHYGKSKQADIKKRLGMIGGLVSVLDTRHVKQLKDETNPHYKTPDHRQWRSAILRRAGYRCEQCGADKCKLLADHIVEIKDGGAATDLNNGQALCASCHTKKTNVEREKRYGLPDWQR